MFLLARCRRRRPGIGQRQRRRGNPRRLHFVRAQILGVAKGQTARDNLFAIAAMIAQSSPACRMKYAIHVRPELPLLARRVVRPAAPPRAACHGSQAGARVRPDGRIYANSARYSKAGGRRAALQRLPSLKLSGAGFAGPILAQPSPSLFSFLPSATTGWLAGDRRRLSASALLRRSPAPGCA